MQRLHLQEPIQLDNLRASQMLSQIRLESLPKMNLLVQSDTTSILVRQLTCLLNVRNNYTKSDTTMHTLLLSQKANTHKTPEAEIITLHIQNTKATECCDLLKPSLQVALQLPALLLGEQIAQNACTLCQQIASTSLVRKRIHKKMAAKNICNILTIDIELFTTAEIHV